MPFIDAALLLGDPLKDLVEKKQMIGQPCASKHKYSFLALFLGVNNLGWPTTGAFQMIYKWCCIQPVVRLVALSLNDGAAL